MDYKKAQIIALAMIASAILSGTGFIALAIRPSEDFSVVAILIGGISFLLSIKFLYDELYKKPKELN